MHLDTEALWAWGVLTSRSTCGCPINRYQSSRVPSFSSTRRASGPISAICSREAMAEETRTRVPILALKRVPQRAVCSNEAYRRIRVYRRSNALVGGEKKNRNSLEDPRHSSQPKRGLYCDREGRPRTCLRVLSRPPGHEPRYASSLRVLSRATP